MDKKNIILKSDIQLHIDNFKDQGPNTWLKYGCFGDPLTIDGLKIDIEKNTTNFPFYGLELFLRFNELEQDFHSSIDVDQNPYSTFKDNRGQIVFTAYKLKNIKVSEIFEEVLVYEVSQTLAIARVIDVAPEKYFVEKDKLNASDVLQRLSEMAPFDPEKFTVKKCNSKHELHYNDNKNSFLIPLYALYGNLDEESNNLHITDLKINDGLIFIEGTHISSGYHPIHKIINLVFNAESLSLILKKDKRI